MFTRKLNYPIPNYGYTSIRDIHEAGTRPNPGTSFICINNVEDLYYYNISM